MSYRFHVLELADRPSLRTRSLAELANQNRARAALRATFGEDGGIELWVANPDAARTGDEDASGSQEVVRADAKHNPELLVLRVTEAMRARGLELAQAPKAGSSPPLTAAPIAVAPTNRAPARSDTNTTGLDVTPPQPVIPEPANAARSGAAPTTPTAAPPTSGAAAPVPVAPKPTTPSATPRTAAAPAARPPDAVTAQDKPSTRPAAAAGDAKRNVDTAPTRPEPQRDSDASDSAADAQRAAETSESVTARPSGLDRLFYAEVAGAGVFTVGQLAIGPGVDVLAHVRWQMHPSASLSAFAFFPVWQSQLVLDEGDVHTTTWMLGGAADLHAPPLLGSRLHLSAGLGAAACLISLTAESRIKGLRKNDQPQQQRMAAMLARIGVAFALTSTLSLRAQGVVGVTLPGSLHVRFAEQDVARWGWPLVIATLGLELALPWTR
jgi:hypothetical protein